MNLIDKVKLFVYESSIDDDARVECLEAINESYDYDNEEDILDILESVVDYINAYESKGNAYRRAADVLLKDRENARRKQDRLSKLRNKYVDNIDKITDHDKLNEYLKKIDKVKSQRAKYKKQADNLHGIGTAKYRLGISNVGHRPYEFEDYSVGGGKTAKKMLSDYFNSSPKDRSEKGIQYDKYFKKSRD